MAKQIRAGVRLVAESRVMSLHNSCRIYEKLCSSGCFFFLLVFLFHLRILLLPKPHHLLIQRLKPVLHLALQNHASGTHHNILHIINNRLEVLLPDHVSPR